MARTFADMQIEVLERAGRDDGRFAARVRRWLNDAMHEVDQDGRWEYLLTSTSGAAPLTIADLDRVESVADTTADYALTQVDRDALVDAFADLTTTGTALYWYRSAPTTIAVYPVSTLTLTVKYFKFGPDMAAGTDAPLMPDRFRQAIVERATATALRAVGDLNGAAACMQEYDRVLQAMRESLLSTPAYQLRSYASEDD
jgi:hypothetical protein